MRQNTLSVIGQQVRAHTPPDHAGVQYDDDGCARNRVSCWVAVYQCQLFLTTLSVNPIANPI